MGNRYDRFKMKVRKTLLIQLDIELFVGNVRMHKQNDRCVTCQIEFAVSWGKHGDYQKYEL